MTDYVAIVEQERDKARDSLREACRLAQSYKVDAHQATERAEAAERQRDEVQERADQLRDERDDAVQACITLGRALDEWQARAEAAEARTAPAVTRAGVKNAIDTCFALAPKINTQVISDAVCDFLGVEAESAGPVELRARELYRAATPDARWETVADEYRRIAAHVLGQEASDE